MCHAGYFGCAWAAAYLDCEATYADSIALQDMCASCGVPDCLFPAGMLMQKWVHTAIKLQLATYRLPRSRKVDFLAILCRSGCVLP